MSIFAIVCMVILLLCIIGGTRKGMARIIYGMIAWIFVFWFVNFGTVYIQDYLTYNTELSETIKNHVTENLKERYKESEKEEEGSGKDALLKVIPKPVRESLEDKTESSLNNFIDSISTTFTDYAMKGISVILAIVISGTIVAVLGELLIAFDIIPGISNINRLLGGSAGMIETVMIIWVIMVIADFFPTSYIGKIVIEAVDCNGIIRSLYEKNILRIFIQ